MVTGQHIHYLHICKRKLWLLLKGISMETSSERVLEGKHLHDTAYKQRAEKWREIDLGCGKIDYFDPKTNTVMEVKTSDKMEWAHEAQVLFYLYTLEQMGVEKPNARLEYPLLRKTKELVMNDGLRAEVKKWKNEVEELYQITDCPPCIDKPFCKNCSFHDFCYIGHES
ncbi:CRISPR-associated protein Cas4 [Flammeovirga aprica]|uniref:CRISPR-associated exonuclease Cas4 n=1 Tax=Flammeovirga aprica JL-4 TaxID=694437 RepID=A0A7X9RXS1_9BACT|nr:CRISPR-associated protein Cas4 [Flammeovirga aprica]NME70539.1 CRISPR-associated protein Cas4 [Flammeovirga aprica JL-4]